MNKTDWFVYIVECSDKSLYTGITNNLDRRLKEHNNNILGSKYTRIRRPVKIIHFETFITRSQALKKENEIKGWNRKRKLQLIKNN